MKINYRILFQFVVVLVLPFLQGCSSSIINLGLGKQTQHEQESPENPVVEIITAWQESEGPGVKDQLVSRGFGGQIYFITEKRGLPSEVQGGIRVYLFDDQGTPEEQTKPIYQFDFTPEAWKLHTTMTKLGPAYTVFIPYTRPGRHLAQCALRVRYTPPNSPAIYSKMTSLTLPGAKKILPGSEPADAPKSEMAPDGTLTLKSTTAPRATQFRNSTIKTVGNEEPAEAPDVTQRKSGIRTANFDTEEDAETSRPVRSAPAAVQRRAQVPETDEADEAMEAEPPKRKNPVARFADEIEEPQTTVRTYSIPLD